MVPIQGIFVGYRGYEIKKLKPLFPFGYGLSYTSFEYSALEVSPITPAGEFTVSFTITYSTVGVHAVCDTDRTTLGR